MEAKEEAEQEENSKTVMKLPLLPSHSHNNHSISSPIHRSIAASVPFSWEQEPGKPKHSPPSSSFSTPLPSQSPSSSETNKSLELPPRLNGGSVINLQSPNTVFDGPYSMARSRRLESPSFKMIVKGNGGDSYGSFRSENYGDLEDVEEEYKEQKMSGGGSVVLVKKPGRLGFFGFRRRRAVLKGKTEFGRGSYVFPSSVEKEEEEEKRLDFGEGNGDAISSSQSSRFNEVKITKISRTGSFSDLPAISSTKSRFWTNVYAGLKQVVPWKNKKTTG